MSQTDVSNKALQNFFHSIEKGESTKVHSSESSSEDASDEELQEEESEQQESKVFAELKKEITKYYGHKTTNPLKLDTVNASRLINKLEAKAYDEILIKVLTKVLSISRVVPQEIEEWKEIIQKRISSILKHNSLKPKKKNRKNRIEEKQKKNFMEKKPKSPDLCKFKRNDPEVVLSIRWFEKYGEEISFRERMIKILKSMKTRTFSVLHQKLFDFIRELSKKTYKRWKFPANLENQDHSILCTSNWWYRYTRGDQELKNLWNSLRFSRR